MENIPENLERHYKNISGKIDIFEFFTGLSDYLRYVTSRPQLKELTDSVLEKKRLEYHKLTELEDKSLIELNAAKVKLLEIIKENKIDPKLLTGRFSAMADGDVLNALERFEKGEITISGYKTDNLESYLSDIAIDISRLGFNEELKEFVDPNKNPQNVFGNFEFSKTLQESRKQREKIVQSRAIDIWAPFDELIKFHNASKEVAQNTPWGDVAPKYAQGATNYMEIKDAVDVAFLAGEWGQVVKSNSNTFPKETYRDLHKLNVSKFKGHTDRAHAYLMTEIPLARSSQSKLAEQRKAITRALEKKIEENRSEERIEEMVRNIVAEILQDRDDVPKPSEKFWSDGDMPTYDEAAEIVRLGERFIQLPIGSNQSQLCKALFKIPYGEWLSDIDVRDNFFSPTETSFQNAVRAINDVVSEKFGIEKLLKYQGLRVRIRKELFENS